MQVFRSAVRLRQPITPLFRSTLQYSPICTTINHNRINTIFHSTTRSYSDGSGKEYRQNIFGTPFLESSLSEAEVKVKVAETLQKMEDYATRRIEKSIDFINKAPSELKVSNKCLDIISDIVKIRRTYYGEDDVPAIYWNTIKAGILRTIDNLTLAEVIIHENLVQIEQIISKTPKSLNTVELYELYASITEEYSRILSAQEKYSPSEKIVKTTLEEIENSGFAEKLVPYQLILNRYLTNIYIQQGREDEANAIITKYLDRINLYTSDAPSNLRYRVLNDFHSNKVEIAQFLIIKAKLCLENEAFKEVLTVMQRVCTLVENGTPYHIFAVVKILSEFIQEFEEKDVDLLWKKQLLNLALLLSIRTENTLHSYDQPSALLSVLQFGLRNLLKVPGEKKFCAKMLHEALRLQFNYPSHYPATNEELFTQVMTLCQLYKEINKADEAIFLIQQFMPLFEKIKNANYIVNLIELQAQLVILDVFGDDAERLAKKPISKTVRVPLSKQVQNITKCQKAIAGLETVIQYYKKKNEVSGLIKSYHTLAVIETLQEDFPYADHDCAMCIRYIAPEFNEYPDRVHINENVAVELLPRLCDLLLLRGTLLRVLHEPVRAQHYLSLAYRFLQKSRASLLEDPVAKLQEEMSRGSDISRCLELMIELTDSSIVEEKSNPNALPDRITELERYRRSLVRKLGEAKAELKRLNSLLASAHQTA